MEKRHFRHYDLLSGHRLQGLGMANVTIAIDGPSASGKGSLAKRLARRLNFAYLDTGLLYRKVGIELARAGAGPEDKEKAVEIARTVGDNLNPETLEDPELRTDKAGSNASQVAAIPGVRQAMLEAQKNFARNPSLPDADKPVGGAILDGRDIGTVICPDADIKIFVQAETGVRAERRYKELQSRGINVTYEAVLKDLRERDARDAGRDAAPMKPAPDAFILDTTSLSEQEVLDEAMGIIRGHLVGRLAES